MKFNSPLFDRIRVKPGEDRRAAAGRAVLRVEGLRQHRDASRAQGPAARERVLALLPRPRARVQPLVQLLRRHERGRRLEVPEGRRHRPPADLEDGHRQPSGRRRLRRRRARRTRSTCSASSAPAPAGGRSRSGSSRRARCATPSARRCTSSASKTAPNGRDQGAVQGAGEAPPSRRQRRRPRLRGQAARDHPGLQLSEVDRRLLSGGL